MASVFGTYNATLPADNLPRNSSFYASILSALARLGHLCTHPKIKDWLQLLLFGITATLIRRASTEALGWLQRVFCITSTHLTNDESYDWLMGTLLSVWPWQQTTMIHA